LGLQILPRVGSFDIGQRARERLLRRNIVSDNNGASNLGFFMAGLGIGAILALLFAPTSGKEARDFLTQKAGEGRDYVTQKAGEGRDYITSKGRDLRDQASDYVDQAKDVVTKQKEQLSAALEAGRQAYQEERGKR
jgi:gas vesicle protein